MRIADSNWMQIEAYLKRDQRCVVPLGCTEQHAYLSLSTDSILAEKVAIEAAEPLGVPVFPVQAYGITPSFRAYPGTISLRIETYFSFLRDLVDGLEEQGFRKVLFVNGHGGNIPGQAFLEEWLANHPDSGMTLLWHNWWNATATYAKAQSFDPEATHANWMENFPWTRLEGVTLPANRKPMVDYGALKGLGPQSVRNALGDGSFGGLYERSDDEMHAIWQVAIEETRDLVESL